MRENPRKERIKTVLIIVLIAATFGMLYAIYQSAQEDRDKLKKRYQESIKVTQQ